jgi:hypothetical protein
MIRWGRGARAIHHHAVEISNLPGFSIRIIAEAWNQVQMQMPGAFAKADGINALTAAEALHQP